MRMGFGLLSLFGEEFVEVGDRFDALVEVDEAVLFVGAVEVVAVESEAHEDDLDAELFFEEGADRDAAAAAYRDGGFVGGGFDGPGRCLVGLAIYRCHIGFAAVMLFSL